LISVKKTTEHFSFLKLSQAFIKRSFLKFQICGPFDQKSGYIGCIEYNSPYKILQKEFNIEQYIALRRRNRS